MIELHDVTKAYPTPMGLHVVLNRLTATFADRQSVGILGRNGAGKSTLLRVLGGAELPDGGKVVRTGRVSWPIGFAGGFNGSLNGRENCRFVARLYQADLDEVCDFAQRFADIGDYFHAPLRTYSSGMRARLAFGLSMAIDFDTYLVDEVTAVGDKRFQDKCQQAFADRQERSAVIIVSHQVNTIKKFCTRAALLNHGKLAFYDDIDEALELYEAA